MPQWSHTRIETYRQCPRRYHFRYVARVELPEEPETLARFLGKRVHESLEWLYRSAQRGAVPAREELLADYRRRWDAEWHDAVMMPDERTPAGHRDEGARWLGDYHARHAPFEAERTMDLERRIAFALDPRAGHTMTGFIDRLARGADGTWRIHDYKTNRRLPTQQEKDADPQLAYYEIGIRTMWPGEVADVELVWHFLAFDTALTSRRSGAQLESLRGEALATIGEIVARGRAEAAFPTHESRLCDFCEFQQVCPVRRHRFATGSLPPSKYANEPGVALVNAWAELDAKRAELKARIEEIEAEIDDVRAHVQAYADEHGLEVVTGEEREATVKRSEKVVFPRKSYDGEAEEAAALEAQLRGSSHWPEVSDVDRAALARLWARRTALDADLRALLEEFARTEEQVDVRLRKRKS